jgi:hypothetical protein
MADPKTEQEPSIEEILQSIRQIISDDGTASNKKAEESVMTVAPENDDAGSLDLSQADQEDKPEDVLELTDIVEDTGAGLDLRPGAEEQDPSIDLGPQQMDQQMTSNLDLSRTEDSALLSDTAATAAASAMSKLLAGNVAVERETVGRAGPVTLEEMTRDLMRPLVKSWLDQNLPAIVEKLVAKELEKVSRRAMDR